MPAPHTLDGWYVLHDFRTVKREAWKALDGHTAAAVMRDLRAFIEAELDAARARTASFGAFVIAGGKADLLFVYMRPTLEELNDVKARFESTRFADFTDRAYSYVSVVELGGYLAKPGVDIEQDEALQLRLKPPVPNMRYVCFYPMNKRRVHPDNWYMLDEEERRKHLIVHGQIGRQYAGKVKQIISGSVGLDDWEWGVTLYADDPIHFKKLIYEMRFDESSARFAEFGPFYVGQQVDHEALTQWMMTFHG
ncbi:hydrogen peroxide-dependent heme synthase [Alicyclobacillus vulcanalis]|uniref:Coproheme decarboxylase n=1 Tax=Alicyclobacillus vulcanalis TaxID=252246 RepID=A0A1N7KMC4_9BACL|nr:hydrogen peroxide-dependent heme synthase [Alicyclobacillus vulcanalis]SIS62779.1 chlorite dismutase [Alicyclobacillus vulcanalis]